MWRVIEWDYPTGSVFDSTDSVRFVEAERQMLPCLAWSVEEAIELGRFIGGYFLIWDGTDYWVEWNDASWSDMEYKRATLMPHDLGANERLFREQHNDYDQATITEVIVAIVLERRDRERAR